MQYYSSLSKNIKYFYYNEIYFFLRSTFKWRMKILPHFPGFFGCYDTGLIRLWGKLISHTANERKKSEVNDVKLLNLAIEKEEGEWAVRHDV